LSPDVTIETKPERAVEIELLMDAHAIIGESPTWVAAEQAVYWIDVKAPALHRPGESLERHAAPRMTASR
jgi:sugar lactone lactonase YvrE